MFLAVMTGDGGSSPAAAVREDSEPEALNGATEWVSGGESMEACRADCEESARLACALVCLACCPGWDRECDCGRARVEAAITGMAVSSCWWCCRGSREAGG